MNLSWYQLGHTRVIGVWEILPLLLEGTLMRHCCPILLNFAPQDHVCFVRKAHKRWQPGKQDQESLVPMPPPASITYPAETANLPHRLSAARYLDHCALHALLQHEAQLAHVAPTLRP